MKLKVLKVVVITVMLLMMSTFVVSAADTVTVAENTVASGVAIDVNNFPDDVFRSYVSTSFDVEGGSADGYLSNAEIQKVTNISVSGRSIASLSGIEYFTMLKRLNCENTRITELDVSNNTALGYLWCQGTGITELNISNNAALVVLKCSNTELTALDVSNNVNLVEFSCYNTEISELDLSNNKVLASLTCYNTEITALDVSSNIALEYLWCYGTGITEVDISKNIALKELRIDTGTVGCSYDFSNIVGFNPSKTSEWDGAVYANGKISDFKTGKATVACKYDLGNETMASYVFYINSTGNHNCVNNICVDCGYKYATGEVEPVIYSDKYAGLRTGVVVGDEAVYNILYTIYDAEKKPVAKVEYRVGTDTTENSIFYLGETLKSVSRRYSTDNGERILYIDINDWKGYLPGEGYTYSFEKTLLENIASVEYVCWDNNSKPGIICWKNTDDVEQYIAKLYKETENGKECVLRSYIKSGQHDFSGNINESGTYIVEVKAIGNMFTGDSEWVAGEPYVYVKPDEIFSGTNKIWWTSKEGEVLPTIINWKPVAGANGYEIRLLYELDGKTKAGLVKNVYNTADSLATSLDWTDTINNINERYGNGDNLNFFCMIRALSGNIEVVANSTYQDAVLSGDYVLSTVVEEGVKETVTNSTTDTIIADIAELGVENIADVIQNNTKVLGKIGSIEDEYVNINNIMVLEPKVTHSIINEVKVVGVGLNGEVGDTLQLKVEEIEEVEKKKINQGLYENTVQVNISLIGGEDKVKGKLAAPIAITLKTPEDMDENRVVILHYVDESEIERIYPVVNGDGTITFSVTSFSTFVFANMVYYGEVELPDDDTPDTPTPTPPAPITPPAVDPTPDAPDYDDEEEDYDPLHWIKYSWKGKAGWQKVSGNWYYFVADGDLKTGWVEDTDGKWYYMDEETCEMQTGWVLSKKSGLWYYMDATNGDMQSNGWLCDPESGRWYYLDANGAMCTSWIVVDGMWYLLDTNGAMCTGWNKVNDDWYLLGSNGAMLTGWQTVGDKEYYLDENGKCLMNTTTPDGFAVDENGAKIK